MGCGASAPVVDEENIGMSWFSKERVIGKGGFGKVNAVRKVVGVDNETWYAMKTIAKLTTVNKGSSALAQVANELHLLRDLRHPRLIELHYAFHDDTMLYMVTDICLGGDLRFHLHYSKKKQNPCVDASKGKRWMSEKTVRHYCAQVLLGLRYLHQQKILHRDLKPENVVLTEEGQAKLIDFGIAAEVSAEGQCYQRSGTSVYMAPEISLKGHAHSYASDFYSFGVLIYELLVGFNPFISQANSRELYAVKKSFSEKEIARANGLNKVSGDCMDILKALLQHDPSKRLGGGPGGAEDVMAHPWFKSVDWTKMEKDEVDPPFVPECKTSNFASGKEDLIESFFPEADLDKAKDIKELEPHQDKFTFFHYNKLQVNKSRRNSAQKGNGSRRNSRQGSEAGLTEPLLPGGK